MCHDITSNRFLSIRWSSWHSIYGSHYLIRDHHCNSILCRTPNFSQMCQKGRKQHERGRTSSANRSRPRKNLAKCICRADNSPRPLKSVRYNAVAESTINSENLTSSNVSASDQKRSGGKREGKMNLDSAIIAPAWINKLVWWSALYALAYATLSNTSSPFIPYLSAIAKSRTGRNVPSVSMYKHFPSPPFISIGSCRQPIVQDVISWYMRGRRERDIRTWQVTASWWQIWDLPVLNSPYNSVILPVSIPPTVPP